MEYSQVLVLLAALLSPSSLASPIPQQQSSQKGVFEAYSPGSYQQQPNNGQLRAYAPTTSGLKRVRLVQVPHQGQGQGQVVYRLASPQALPAEGQKVGGYKEPEVAYVQRPIPVISPLQRPVPRKVTRIHGGRPVGLVEETEAEDYPSDPNPEYNFSFDVKDDELTNYQNRQEERQDGVIKGSYSVVDPDGYVRTVTYTADSKNGFQAKVVREPTDVKIKFPVPTQSPEVAGLKVKSPIRTQQFQYAQGAYTQGSHVQPKYVLRRVPTNHESEPHQRYVKVLRQ